MTHTLPVFLAKQVNLITVKLTVILAKEHTRGIQVLV